MNPVILKQQHCLIYYASEMATRGRCNVPSSEAVGVNWAKYHLHNTPVLVPIPNQTISILCTLWVTRDKQQHTLLATQPWTQHYNAPVATPSHAATPSLVASLTSPSLMVSSTTPPLIVPSATPPLAKSIPVTSVDALVFQVQTSDQDHDSTFNHMEELNLFLSSRSLFSQPLELMADLSIVPSVQCKSATTIVIQRWRPMLRPDELQMNEYEEEDRDTIYNDDDDANSSAEMICSNVKSLLHNVCIALDCIVVVVGGQRGASHSNRPMVYYRVKSITPSCKYALVSMFTTNVELEHDSQPNNSFMLPRRLDSLPSSSSCGRDGTIIATGKEGLPHIHLVYRIHKELEQNLVKIGQQSLVSSIRSTSHILIYGPHGNGKTASIRAIAKKLKIPLVYLNLSNIGESELVSRLTASFRTAISISNQRKRLVVLFLDEIDQLMNCGKRYRMSVLTTLYSLFDELMLNQSQWVSVIGATVQLDSVNMSLRRYGRFQEEICFPPPNVDERALLLSALLEDQQLAEEEEVVDDNSSHDDQAHLQSQEPPNNSNTVELGENRQHHLKILSEKTVGFVTSDLISLYTQGALVAVKQGHGRVTADSLLSVQLSSQWLKSNEEHTLPGSDSFSQSASSTTKQQVTWDDICGLDEVKLQLKKCAEWPILYRDSFERLGLTAPRGVLLYGPPGCAKTSLVRALAHSTHCTFIYLNSALVYSPYLGDAEKYIRQVFAQARAAQPSVIFMDEMESLVGSREWDTGGSGGIEKRVLSTLLNEMDGIEHAKNVLVIGATNRPDRMDAALMRPGRLDHVIMVPPPDHTSRLGLIKRYAKRCNDEHTRQWLASNTHMYTGADLEALCREAALVALRQDLGANQVTKQHFEQAMKVVQPSLNHDTLQQYMQFQQDAKK